MRVFCGPRLLLFPMSIFWAGERDIMLTDGFKNWQDAIG